MIRKLDSWVLGKFEQFSHWTQTTFGITSVTWERLCLLVSVIFFVTREIEWDIAHHRLVILAIDIVILCWLGARAVFAEAMRPKVGSMLMNSSKVDSIRPFSLVVVLALGWIDIFTMRIWYEFSVAAYYFGSCDDLPPGLSRVKKFLQSLTARLVPQVQE